MRRIRPCEVKKALHQMRTRKTVGPDEIPIEVWNILESLGLSG